METKQTLAQKFAENFKTNEDRHKIFKELHATSTKVETPPWDCDYKVTLEDGSVLALIDGEYWDIRDT